MRCLGQKTSINLVFGSLIQSAKSIRLMHLLDLLNQCMITSTSLWFLQVAEDWYENKWTTQAVVWLLYIVHCFTSKWYSATMHWKAGCLQWMETFHVQQLDLHHFKMRFAFLWRKYCQFHHKEKGSNSVNRHLCFSLMAHLWRRSKNNCLLLGYTNNSLIVVMVHNLPT